MVNSKFKIQNSKLISMVGLGGLEPPTSRLSGVRSNQNWAIGPFFSYTLKDQNIDLSKLNSKNEMGVDLGMNQNEEFRM